MPYQAPTDELDFGCDCPKLGEGYCCRICRPDICNSDTPMGVGLCASASTTNSANLTPVAAPQTHYSRYYGTGDSGRHYMKGANRSPSASTPSSGQGPSNSRPIQQQPARNENMHYPHGGSAGYGTMQAQYSGLAQSPVGGGDFYGGLEADVAGAGAGAGDVGGYGYGDSYDSNFGVGGSSQQSYMEDPRDTKGKGKSNAKHYKTH